MLSIGNLRMLFWRGILSRLREIGEGKSLLLLFLKLIGKIYIKIKMINLNSSTSSKDKKTKGLEIKSNSTKI